MAEAEHGGFFQALADGTYKRYGLDVTIVPGGPNDNNRMLLIAGKIDFFMAANTLMSFDAVTNHVPVVTIAAIFLSRFVARSPISAATCFRRSARYCAQLVSCQP